MQAQTRNKYQFNTLLNISKEVKVPRQVIHSTQCYSSTTTCMVYRVTPSVTRSTSHPHMWFCISMLYQSQEVSILVKPFIVMLVLHYLYYSTSSTTWLVQLDQGDTICHQVNLTSSLPILPFVAWLFVSSNLNCQ